MERGLLDQIKQELEREAAKLQAIRYGRIVLHIQDGRLVRIEWADSRQVS